ncbi:MAG: YfhO family protein [Candidatus Latescibacterota bacterium]|nr:YfhO family protein [Candidatus Latescibacterota bacterium]
MLFGLIALSPKSTYDVWTSIFWSDIPQDKLQVAAANLPSLGTGAMLGFLWLGGMTLLVTLRLRQRIPAQTFLLALLPILLIDTWRIDKQYLKYVDPDRFPDPRVYIPSTLNILETDYAYHRTWVPAGDVTLPDIDLVNVSYHEPFILRRYDTITKQLDQFYRQRQNDRLLKLLNVLNVKYIATTTQRLQELLPAVIEPGSTQENVTLRSGIEAISNERNVYLFRNQNARPFFYLASNAINVDSEDQAIQAITAGSFDPVSEVVLEDAQTTSRQPRLSTTETVRVDAFDERDGEIKLSVNVEHPRYLVISQNYHPHWSATLDGQPVEIRRANYVWQTITVPPGEHTIALTYYDSLAVICRWISLISALLLIGGSVYFGRSRPEQALAEAA